MYLHPFKSVAVLDMKLDTKFIKHRIKDLGMTYSFVARKIYGDKNSSRTSFSRLINNDCETISLYALSVLCSYLHCLPNDLFVLRGNVPVRKYESTATIKEESK